jgi:hypothetical protein
MKADLTTKLLLALVLAALCALLIHGVGTPALAQSQPAPSTDTPAIAVLGSNGSLAYVVSGGKISLWEAIYIKGKPKIVMQASEPLPAR